MSAASPLIAKLASDWPAETWQDVTVLVAVSGGADSVALARGLHELKLSGEGRLVIAHFNHRLRGAESDGDQAFVESLAAELGLAVVAGERERGRGGEGEKGCSEESLRELRYEFLARAAEQAGARYVVSAHTADDQVETVLHNILRGTGLAGLAGIPRVRPLTASTTLIRPLLGVTRAEVLEYLSSLGQSYREDSSNQSTSYTRNRLRHELLPLLARDYNPHVREALLRLSQIAAEADAWQQEQVGRLAATAVRNIAGGVEIDLHALQGGSEPAFRPLLMSVWRQQGWPLQDMTYDKWDQLRAFAQSPAPTRGVLAPETYPGNIRAERQGGVLRLTRPAC
jgi:tRNA(Ile)-lysidine synthase